MMWPAMSERFIRNLKSNWENWRRQHSDAVRQGISKLREKPAAAGFSITMIAIAILPALVLATFSDQIRDHITTWQQRGEVALFLKDNVDKKQADLIAQELKSHPALTQLEIISPEQALEEFRQQTPEGNDLKLNAGELFPYILWLQFANDMPVTDINAQLAEWKNNPALAIDSVQLHQQWLSQLRQLQSLIARLTIVITLMSAMALLFVTSNTIRLQIRNHADEIRVLKWIGATAQFIRRPYLYFSLITGSLSTLAAALLQFISYLFLKNPIEAVFPAINDISFHLFTFNFTLALVVVCILSLTSAWIATNLEIRNINTNPL